MEQSKRKFLSAVAAMSVVGLPGISLAAKAKNAPGVTSTEIKMGETLPLSGPAAAYSAMGAAARAYFEMIKDQGGINGRKLTLLQLDDAYSPPKTMEQMRKLVDQERVAFIVAQVGTPTSIVARKYLNQRKVPQLFVGSGAATWADDIEEFPWSLGWQPLYSDEGREMAKHMLAANSKAKIALIYQNDDAGKDFARGLKEGLSGAGKQLALEQSHEVTDPTVDSQVIAAQASGADVFVMWGSPKATAQAIRKAADLGWTPAVYINQNSSSVKHVLTPAGLDKSKGVIAGAFMKDAADPAWNDDKGMQEWKAFMDKYNAGAAKDSMATYGTSIAQTTVQVLKQCGDDLSRENIIKQTMHLDLELPLLLPGLRVKTSPASRHPVRGLRFQQFDGSSWKLMA